MTNQTLFDPGLQPERTALAWRRTSLALGTASLLAVRVLGEFFGTWAAMTAGFGVLAAVWITFLAHRRHGVVLSALTSRASPEGQLPSGGLLAFTASFVLAAGLIALILVLVTAP
ncbi:DUF202 domain-containing protein [Pengzhenrongella phosphoraccumulans]|uniref:DUF202 domain-containing protein n=1 Tax=Pengzhenrongella phosphoraccumulans TaxID=3114394 RepID=UPI0038907EED